MAGGARRFVLAKRIIRYFSLILKRTRRASHPKHLSFVFCSVTLNYCVAFQAVVSARQYFSLWVLHKISLLGFQPHVHFESFNIQILMVIVTHLFTVADYSYFGQGYKYLARTWKCQFSLLQSSFGRFHLVLNRKRHVLIWKTCKMKCRRNLINVSLSTEANRHTRPRLVKTLSQSNHRLWTCSCRIHFQITCILFMTRFFCRGWEKNSFYGPEALI